MTTVPTPADLAGLIPPAPPAPTLAVDLGSVPAVLSHDAETLRIAREWRRISSEIRDLLAIEADLKAQLRKRAHLGDTVTDPELGPLFKLQPNRAFDQHRARALLEPDVLKRCVKEVVDSAAVKRLVPPAVYEACMADRGEPKVVPA